MQIPYTKKTLANGLDVIVHEDHQLPMVAVNLWYHVGSKNERPGRTGFAHLFEHLMFEGSKHHDSGYFEPLQRAGGLLNGSTNTDRTNYWEVMPTGALELVEPEAELFSDPLYRLGKRRPRRHVMRVGVNLDRFQLGRFLAGERIEFGDVAAEKCGIQ